MCPPLTRLNRSCLQPGTIGKRIYRSQHNNQCFLGDTLPENRFPAGMKKQTAPGLSCASPAHRLSALAHLIFSTTGEVVEATPPHLKFCIFPFSLLNCHKTPARTLYSITQSDLHLLEILQKKNFGLYVGKRNQRHSLRKRRGPLERWSRSPPTTSLRRCVHERSSGVGKIMGAAEAA